MRLSPQPRLSKDLVKAVMRACPALSASLYAANSTAICRTFLLCCERAASGHVAATLPTRPINSRRLIASPEAHDNASYRLKPGEWKQQADVRFGSKADIAARLRYVRFTLESGHVRRS